MTQLPMFPTPEREPPLKRVAPQAQLPQWRTYTGRKRHLCDDCMVLVHRGEQSFPRVAVYIRSAEETERFLCSEHQMHWRDLDRKEAALWAHSQARHTTPRKQSS